MALRKEQVVLVGTVAVLGFLVWKSVGADAPKSGPPKKPKPLELVRQDVPDTDLVLPAKRTLDPDARDLFSPPSDTRPLPPLELIAPPSAALPALRPPTVPGPIVALYGKFLRVSAAPIDVPDLFVDAADVADTAADAPGAAAGKGAKPPKIDSAAATPEQIAARIASRKKLYDWIRIGDYRFGEIRNPNRYELAKRPNEDVLFVEYNPDTGLPKFPGQPPTPVPRKTVNEFDFAQTVANQIEIRRAQFGNPLPASEYDLALEFADWCIEQSLETPRALVVAEEMYRRAAAVLSEAPAPRLGLARVWEAGFQFEKAFQEYNALIEGNLKGNPLVMVSLAKLEARFRMTEKARARLVEAERLGRNEWQVQEALGTFLLENGDAKEAVAHLRIANQVEPQGAGDKRVRARLRTALGGALIAIGNVTEGREWIEKALQADPTDPIAQAALVSAAVTAAKPGTSSDASVGAADKLGDGEAQGFELLLANGMAQANVRTPESAAKARANLVAAAAADPLRAYLPWRALSFLAETTNHPEEAVRFVDLALENHPLDAWSLYQRGRLAAAKDDLDGAAESFKAALDRDISFVDALAALGELSHRRGDFASADRYYDRALSLDPTLTDVQAMRGVNYLELGAMRDAEDCFKKALAVDPDHPTARNGQAWCYYRRGDATEAIARLRELDDNRRSFPATDPHRVWAVAQIGRLTDHLEKVAWTDRFERVELRNFWSVQENYGPTFSIHDGLVTMAGTFKSEGRARMWQVKNATDFVSAEARVTIHTGTNARVGLFVSREQQRAGETQVEAEVNVSRHHESGKNTLQTRNYKRGQEDLPYTDVAGFEWKLDVPVLVRIERTGDKETPRVRITFDGIPVLDGAPIPTLGRSTNDLRLGIFAEGQVGRTCNVDIDDFEIVYRARGK